MSNNINLNLSMKKNNEMSNLLVEECIERQEEQEVLTEMEVKDYDQQLKEQESLIENEIEDYYQQEKVNEASEKMDIEDYEQQMKEQEDVCIAGITEEEVKQNTQQLQKSIHRNEAKDDKRN